MYPRIEGITHEGLYVVPRNEVPIRLHAAWSSGLLTRDALRAVLPTAWTDAEFPTRILPLGVWLTMFQSAGYVTDDPALERPTQPLIVYAATRTPHRQMSWSETLEVARWYAARASRFGTQSPVWAARVLPAGVLARIAARDEAEVVVDPRYLIDLLPVNQ